jgi:excinuclease ABC subunit B
MYADHVTASMQIAIDETDRRRKAQSAHNERHGIVPRSTRRGYSPMQNEKAAQAATKPNTGTVIPEDIPVGIAQIRDEELLPSELRPRIEALREEMNALAKELRYEEAARVRDRMRVLETQLLEFGA